MSNCEGESIRLRFKNNIVSRINMNILHIYNNINLDDGISLFDFWIIIIAISCL